MTDRCRTDHGAELARALERARRRCYLRPAPETSIVVLAEPCRAVRPPAEERAALADLIASADRLETYLDALGEPVTAGAWCYDLSADGRLTTRRREFT